MIQQALDAPRRASATVPADSPGTHQVVKQILKARFEEQKVRILGTFDKPLFVAKDVCHVLGIANPRDALASLDDDEKNTVGISDGNRGNPNHNVVNESGLYALIFKSRKAAARRFRKWVTGEVLPALRMGARGGIIPSRPQEPTRLELIEMARSAELERIKLRQQVADAAPAVEFVQTLSTAEGSMSIGAWAKSMNWGRNRLFGWLRGQGYIMPGSTIPYQRHVDAGLFEVTQGVKNDHVWAVAAVTAKGIAQIGQQLNNERRTV